MLMIELGQPPLDRHDCLGVKDLRTHLSLSDVFQKMTFEEANDPHAWHDYHSSLMSASVSLCSLLDRATARDSTSSKPCARSTQLLFLLLSSLPTARQRLPGTVSRICRGDWSRTGADTFPGIEAEAIEAAELIDAMDHGSLDSLSKVEDIGDIRRATMEVGRAGGRGCGPYQSNSHLAPMIPKNAMRRKTRSGKPPHPGQYASQAERCCQRQSLTGKPLEQSAASRSWV